MNRASRLLGRRAVFADGPSGTEVPPRQSELQSWLPWLAGGAFIVLFACRDWLLTRGLLIGGEVAWGRDFINVWTGGHLIRAGHVSAIYDLTAYQSYQRSLFGSIGLHNYSYPPVSFPIASLLSLPPYPLALLTWQVAGAAFFIWAAKPWWPRNIGPVWLAALTPAALVNIWAGHYGFFVGGLFLLGWRSIEQDRRVLAGVFFGLMLIKPHLAVLVPLVLLLRREWTVIAAAAATVLGLIAVTTALYGWQPWFEFLFDTSRLQVALIDGRANFFAFMSTSPMTAVLALHGGWTAAVVVQLVFAVGAIALVTVAALRAAALRDLALLTATATFLVLPYAFNYDMTVPMLGALTVMAASQSDTQQRLAFYGFVAPQIGMITAAFGLPLMPAMIAGLVISQFRFACAEAAEIDVGRTSRAVPATA